MSNISIKLLSDERNLSMVDVLTEAKSYSELSKELRDIVQDELITRVIIEIFNESEEIIKLYPKNLYLIDSSSYQHNVSYRDTSNPFKWFHFSMSSDHYITILPHCRNIITLYMKDIPKDRSLTRIASIQDKASFFVDLESS